MSKSMKKSHIFLITTSISLAVLFVIAIGFVVWASAALGPSPEALAALQNTNTVQIISNPSWITFQPVTKSANTGLIFYPGGKVEFRSYAPALRQIAEAGYLVVLPNMPLNLAIFDPNKAADIIKAFPQVMNWAVGGHSLGGSMAAMYTAAHPDKIKGLVLWAAYPSSADDLHDKSVKVLMVFGTLDGLVTQSKLDAARILLPLDTFWVPIPGGDHAQFGDYGPQPGDNPAAVSPIEQQMEAVKATVKFLQGLSK
jgi:dienelactone hydrolase